MVAHVNTRLIDVRRTGKSLAVTFKNEDTLSVSRTEQRAVESVKPRAYDYAVVRFSHDSQNTRLTNEQAESKKALRFSESGIRVITLYFRNMYKAVGTNGIYSSTKFI